MTIAHAPQSDIKMIPSPILTQVESFQHWKNDIIRDIARYRAWLRDNVIYDRRVDKELQLIQARLRDKTLSIAFVGEFSRGKSELINALLFSQSEQRLLPSTLGRTTMCPTEIIYEQCSEPYLKLLPIETRQEVHTLQQLKQQNDRWLHIPLDINNSEELQNTLSHIGDTKKITVEEAELLGFDCQFLESSSDAHVYVPTWRHALINIDHPLLRQGIRILDTPGLNALGCEPDLTFNLLPDCQAIVFLLNVDSGVTATDMQIWRDHIGQLQDRSATNLFAILNKIDLLWDDFADDEEIKQSVKKMKSLTAQQLSLEESAIFTLSAKQGLHARIKGDEDLLQKSNIAQFETLMFESLIDKKEQSLRKNAIEKTIFLLGNTKATLQAQLKQLEADNRSIIAMLNQGHGEMKSIAQQAKRDQVLYQNQIIALKASKQAIAKQVNTLLLSVNQDHFSTYLDTTRTNFKDSWSSIGIREAIEHFFICLESDFNHLEIETNTTIKIVWSIYDKVLANNKVTHDDSDDTDSSIDNNINSDINNDRDIHSSEQGHDLDIDLVRPTEFRIFEFNHSLAELKTKATQYQKSFRSLLSGQRKSTHHFFNSVAAEAQQIHQAAHVEAKTWADGLLTPLIQHASSRKQLLDQKVQVFKTLAETNKSQRQKQQELVQFQASIQLQFEDINLMIQSVSQKRPQQSFYETFQIKGTLASSEPQAY